MLKNMLTVLRGTVAAQVIGFVALPLLSRLYTPEAFGMFQLFQSSLAPLLVVAAMRFEIALLRATDGPELAASLQLCLLINLLIALAVTLACGAVSWLVPESLTVTTKGVLWFMPVGVLVGGGLQTIGYLALRKQAFAAGAAAKMAQAGGYVGSAVGIGTLAAASGGLVIADILGRLASIVTFALNRTIFDRSLFAASTRAELLRVARKFRELPLVSAPGQLINSAGGVMTSVLMYGAFDAAVSGHYGLVERSLMLPVGMVAVAVSQVFTADFSTSLRDGGSKALTLYRGLVRRMFFLGLIPACLVALLAPTLFEVVFGTKWAESGVFAQIMAPLMLVALVTGSVNMAITILGWQKVQLGWEVSRLALVSIAWLCVVKFDLSPGTAVAMHVASSIAMSLVYLWLADHMIRRHAALQPKSEPRATP